MKKLLLLALGALLAGGCGHGEASPGASTPPSRSSVREAPGVAERMPESSGAAQAPQPPKAPTAPRTRGADAEPGPAEQDGSTSDFATTAAIRQALLRDTLAPMVKDVKVVTRGGHVVLSGTVRGHAVRQAVETRTRAVGGVVDVDDQIEIRH